MKSSPAVYPVIGNSESRQSIATVLQSMGFDTDDISRAFAIYEKSYGDQKYDISILTDIVFEIQSSADQSKGGVLESHSVPNEAVTAHQKHQYLSPQNDANAQILHHHFIPPQHDSASYDSSMAPPSNHREHRDSVLTSISMDDRHRGHPSKSTRRRGHQPPAPSAPRNRSAAAAADDSESKMDAISVSDSLAKWADDESQVLAVLMATVRGDDAVRSMVDWNDLMVNVERRESEWRRFQKQFEGAAILKAVTADKEAEVRQKLSERKVPRSRPRGDPNSKTSKTSKSSKSATTKGGGTVSGGTLSAMQRALRLEADTLSLSLSGKKEKLLVTANTYSILQRNKERTERTIAKCTEKMEDINRQIEALKNEKKQYFSALMRTKNKLNFQIESVRETEAAIKALHEEAHSIRGQRDCIEAATDCVDRFEDDLVGIGQVLRDHFGRRLEPRWREWTNREVVIWLNHIEQGRLRKVDLTPIQQSGLCGKDLPEINHFVLRSSFKMQHEADRQVVLRNIARITKLRPNPPEIDRKRVAAESATKSGGNEPQKEESAKKGQAATLCVVCSDEEANHIMIPCGHIAVGSNCLRKVDKSKKCPFCGQPITNRIKCFHVGL